MTIFVTWQLIVTLDSIRNSCDVFLPWVDVVLHDIHSQSLFFCSFRSVRLLPLSQQDLMVEKSLEDPGVRSFMFSIFGLSSLALCCILDVLNCLLTFWQKELGLSEVRELTIIIKLWPAAIINCNTDTGYTIYYISKYNTYNIWWLLNTCVFLWSSPMVQCLESGKVRKGWYLVEHLAVSTHWSEIKAQPHLHNLEEMCDKDLLKGGNPRFLLSRRF